MIKAGLKELDIYIAISNNIVDQYIANRPTLDLCLEAEKRPEKRLEKWWWGQAELIIVSTREDTEAGGMEEADR